MSLTLPSVSVRAATPQDALLVHALYAATPSYFEIISMPLPTVAEVRRELEVAAHDERRITELLLLPELDAPTSSEFFDTETSQTAVAFLDLKLDYPEAGDATVNLLLVPEPLQNRGIGRRCVDSVEKRYQGQARRLLASIYGQNPRAVRFWTSLGYSFAIDAKPVLDWYAKDL